MNVKMYAIVSSVIFALVALLHLVRIIGQWPVVIDGWSVPMWASFVGFAVAGFLSFAGFWAIRQIQRFLSYEAEQDSQDVHLRLRRRALTSTPLYIRGCNTRHETFAQFSA